MENSRDNIFIETQKKTNQIMKGFNNKFGSLLGGMNLLESETSEMVANQEDLYEGYDSEEEGLFEDYENENDYDELFEGSDEEKAYLGHEMINGERVEYYLLEEGAYNESLDSTLANFRKNRRLLVDTLLEDAIFDHFVSTLTEENLTEADGAKKRSKARTIRVKDSTSKDGKKLKKTPPAQIITSLAERKSVKQIFKFNKKLRKKLLRFADADGQSGPYSGWLTEHIELIPINLKGVLTSLDATKGSFGKTSQMIKESIKTLKTGKKTAPGYLTDLVLNGLDGGALGLDAGELSDAKDAIMNAGGNLGGLIDGAKAKVKVKGEKAAKEKAAAKVAIALVESFNNDSVEDVLEWAETLMEDDRYDKNTLDADGMSEMSGGAEVPPALEVLMSSNSLGTSFIGMLIQGAASGKYSVKFFSTVDRLAEEGLLSKSVAKEVFAVQEIRSTSSKVAHDFKWLGMFNDLGLLGAKIESKKASKSRGTSEGESFSIKGGKEVVKFINDHSPLIEKLFFSQVPNSGWGGHRKGGVKKMSKSQQKKLQTASGRNVNKYLLEDAMALSPDNLALLIEFS